MTTAVEMAEQGQLTIPESLREQYSWGDGQRFTLIDLGGVFVLSPRPSRVDDLCDSLRDGLSAEGASLEEMLTELRRMRENDAQ